MVSVLHNSGGKLSTSSYMPFKWRENVVFFLAGKIRIVLSHYCMAPGGIIFLVVGKSLGIRVVRLTELSYKHLNQSEVKLKATRHLDVYILHKSPPIYTKQISPDSF